MSEIIEYKGRRFRPAIFSDIGKEVFVSDKDIEFAVESNKPCVLSGIQDWLYPFSAGRCGWKYAWVEIKEPQVVLAKDCVPGRFYESDLGKRRLCVGPWDGFGNQYCFISQDGHNYGAINIRHDEKLTECEQCWPKNFAPSPISAGRHEQGYPHE